MARSPLRELISKVQTYPKGDPLSSTLSQLHPFIPDESLTIAKELAKLFISVVDHGDTEKAAPIFDFLLVMFECAETNRPETLPFAPILAQKKCIGAFFKHVKSGDRRVFRVINFLYEADPADLGKWLKAHSRDLRPLCEVIPASQSEEAGSTLLKIVSSEPQLLSHLMQWIRPTFPKYPLTSALRFMVASAEMRAIIPPEIAPMWMLEHPTCRLGDVKLALDLCPQIWNQDAAAQLFARSLAPDDFADCTWIHNLPNRVLKFGELAIKEVCASVAKGGSDNFMFVRFFVLTFTDPRLVPQEVVRAVSDALLSTCDCAAAGAMQAVAAWSIKFKFQVPAHFVCRLAIRANRDAGAIGTLAKCALRCCCVHSKLALTIVRMDEHCGAYSCSSLLGEPFVFPQFREIFDASRKADLRDYDQALDVIGYFVDYLESKIEE
jgi:hypothetical protein